MRALRLLVLGLFLSTLAAPAAAQFGFGKGKMPKRSVPPTCNTSRKGNIYYDTDDDKFFGCNATTWTELGSMSGLLSDDGTNVTLASGALILPDGLVGSPSLTWTGATSNTGIYSAAANSIDFTANGVQYMKVTNQVNFRSGNAGVPGIGFGVDAGNSDVGLYIIGLSNLGLTVQGALVMDWEDTNVAGAGANLATISSALGIMDGTDTVKGLSIELTSADHTGVGNVIAGITATAYTEDAQTRETWIDLPGGVDVGVSSVGAIFDRQDFNEPMRVIPDDLDNLTIDLADADINLVSTADGIQFEYREELTKTTSSMTFDGAGGLDISADNTIDNEGVEIYLGSSQNTTTGYLIAQTDQLCFSVNVTVALIAGTDQFVIGWRVADAYQDAAAYLSYSDYAVVGINNVDGSVFGLSDSTTGAAESDDSTTNWANTETKTLKQCIDGAGLVHAYLDGTLVVETSRTTAIDSGTVMNPFISYLQAGGAVDPAIIVNWWEITAN